MTETWTFTFGECVENHAGMAKHGQLVEKGFTRDELVIAGHAAKNSGLAVEFYDLRLALPEDKQAEASDSACVLVIRQGAKMFFTPENYPRFIKETEDTRAIVDKKALMRGRVVNKTNLFERLVKSMLLVY